MSRLPRTLRAVLLSTAGMLVGCDDAASGTDLVRQSTQTEASIDTKDCTCNYATQGYASAEACIAEEVDPAPTSEQAACIGKAIDRFPEYKDALDCSLAVEKAFDRCLGSSCDATVWANCEAQQEAADDACPEPCEGLSGQPLTDCQNEALAFLGAVLACTGG